MTSSTQSSTVSRTPSEVARNGLYKHAISGIGAGAISTVSLYPLDLVKLHYQVHDKSPKAYRSVPSGLVQLVRNGGISALYRGMSPALYGATASWGLYFYFYEQAKKRKTPVFNSDRLQSWQHFLCGIEAGLWCIPFTNPIWLIKIRMQVPVVAASNVKGSSNVRVLHPAPVAYTSVTNAFRRIVTEEGFFALYKGAIPAIFLTTNGAFKFVAYEKLKRLYTERVGPNPTLVHTLAMGSCAQVFAHFSTYPYQVIKARLQQGGEAAAKYHGTWDCTKQILAKEGIRGFYKGMTANVLKVIPTGAIIFASYEQISKTLEPFF